MEFIILKQVFIQHINLSHTWWGRSYPLSQEHTAFCSTFGLKRSIGCCGASLWEGAYWACSWDLWAGSIVVEGLQGGLGPTVQQRLAGASALSSLGDFQLLHTRVQSMSCSLKVAQAKHKTQLKVLTEDCTCRT